MKILIVVVLLIPVTAGVVVKIGALFDNTATISTHIFRYAAEIANNEKLANLPMEFDPRPFTITYGNEFTASNSLCELLKLGVSAVFGPSSPSSATHCMNICDAKEIPYIDIKWDANTKPPVINLHPHPDTIANILADLIRKWDWKGFTIVYESAPWLKRVAELLKLYEPKEDTITVRRIQVGLDKTNFRPVLRRVKLSGETNILLDCSIEALPDVLKQAQQVGLMTDKHQFIISSMDLHTVDLDPYQYSGVNITGIRLFDPANPMMDGITKYLADLEGIEYIAKEDAKDKELKTVGAEDESANPTHPVIVTVQSALIYDGILLLAEVFQQFDADQFRTIRLDCNDNEAWENGNSMTNFMRNVNRQRPHINQAQVHRTNETTGSWAWFKDAVFQGLTGEIKFDNRGYRSNFAVEVIELTSTGVEKVGTWNSAHGLNITRPREVEFERVSENDSLENKTVIVMISLTAPYGMLKDSAYNLSGNDRYEGFGIDLIHELSLIIGFNYKFKLQKNGAYGKLNNVTGKWDGMIGEVIAKRADLAITDLTITEERLSGVDFSMPFMNLGISILYQKPKPQPPATLAFMSPFSTEVWIYLGGAYLSVSFCLFILGRISPSEWDNPYPCIEEPTQLENQFSASNALWFTIGALLQQGSEIAPKAASTRATSTIWWFFTLIMVSSYTANLAAFLTIEKPAPVIEKAEDLKKCGTPDYDCPVEFGAKKDGSTLNFFKVSKQDTYMNMYKYMMDRPHLLTSTNEDGLEKAKTENYAFLMESSTIEYLIERNCNLTRVGGLLDEKGYGIAMRKNSSYRGDLSEAVLKLQERGKLFELRTKWWKEKKGGGSCSTKDGGAEAEELKMANMKGIFYVLAGGSAFATLYGIFEWLLIIFLRSKRQKLSFRHELFVEMKFIAKCDGNTKSVRDRKSTSMNSRQSNGSNSYNSVERDMR